MGAQNLQPSLAHVLAIHGRHMGDSAVLLFAMKWLSLTAQSFTPHNMQ